MQSKLDLKIFDVPQEIAAEDAPAPFGRITINGRESFDLDAAAARQLIAQLKRIPGVSE